MHHMAVTNGNERIRAPFIFSGETSRILICRHTVVPVACRHTVIPVAPRLWVNTRSHEGLGMQAYRHLCGTKAEGEHTQPRGTRYRLESIYIINYCEHTHLFGMRCHLQV